MKHLGGSLLERFESAALSSRGVRFLDRQERENFVSYAELYRRTLGVAGGLQALGVRQRDRVAVILPTGPEFYEAFFGVVAAGAVPVPLYPPVRLGRLGEYHERTANMLKASGARLILSNGALARLLGSTLARAEIELGCRRMTELSRTEAARRQIAPDDLALIQFSSGTIAAPKPVPLTHRQVLANVDAMEGMILTAYPETEAFRHSAVSWLPLYHDMGLVGCVFVALSHPADLTLLPPELFVARPGLWLRAISRHRATVSAAPNFAYSLTVDKVLDSEMEGVDLSSWRVALNGAEPVTARVLRRFVDRFRAFGLREDALTPVYGLAEAALAVTFSDLTRPFRTATFDREILVREGRALPCTEGLELVSLGKPLPGCQIHIVREGGTGAAPGELGRVMVRGPSVMDGYQGMPSATAEVLKEGWLDTGDRGFQFEGELYLYGRDKDLVVLRGRNHAPQDIEQALEDVEGVRRGCVAAFGAMAADGSGECLVVLAERARNASSDGDPALAARIRETILDATALVPHRVELLEPGTLPRTSSGKIRRNETRRLYLTGELRPPDRVTRLRLMRDMVWSHFAFWRLGR